MNKDIESYLLSRLSSTYNKYLLPNILCPWGCTKFDLVWQRFLPRTVIGLINDHKVIYLITLAREDFIRFSNDYDCWLFNSKWQIRPSIAVCSEGAFVLTCRDHNIGNDKYMLHPPRQPFHILSSTFPDQLYHTVIKPRTVRSIKACTYSNSFQIHEQRGTFNGIDTYNITSYRQFDFCSKLLSDSESRSI